MGSAGNFDRGFLAGLAILLIVLSFSYLFIVTFYPPAAGSASQHYADVIIGFLLGTVISTVIGFFYGASKQQSPADPPKPPIQGA